MNKTTARKEYKKRIVISEQMLDFLARDAFYGSNELLAGKIKNVVALRDGGCKSPASGLSLEDAIQTVKDMDAGEVLECVERTTIRLMHDDGNGAETELLHGSENSISVIYNNITGRNFADKPAAEHENYLAWVKDQLHFPTLDTEKVFIAVK